MSVSVIVHDSDPDPFSPISADEIRELLEAVGYHVRGVLVRHDAPPPCWLVQRPVSQHFGPFTTRLDAITAADLAAQLDGPGYEILSDDEFHAYLDARVVRP